MCSFSAKDEFINIYNTHINRDGAGDLLNYLERSDFFDAPASTKFHSAYDGGLCEHSINMYKRLLSNVKAEYGDNYTEKISDESIAIIGLLHDICKVACFKKDMKNVKRNGVWEQEPYYVVEDDLPYGHGEKSVYIISGFMKLTRDEAMAINWHMGGFDMRVRGGSYALSDAFYKYPIAFLSHLSDMQATYLDEEK